MVNANRRQADSNRNSRTTDVRHPIRKRDSSERLAAFDNYRPRHVNGVPVAPPPDKGSVVIRQSCRPTRTDSIGTRRQILLIRQGRRNNTREARVEPIEGNTLSQSIGLAAVYPARYGEFQRAAMRAISAMLNTRARPTAAERPASPALLLSRIISLRSCGSAAASPWSSPVSVIPGENVLELSPQSITEISSDTSGYLLTI